jgi:hypothetical protein
LGFSSFGASDSEASESAPDKSSPSSATMAMGEPTTTPLEPSAF